MSRIGKKPVEIPEKTQISIGEDFIKVTGPLGELELAKHPMIEVEISEKELVVKPVKLNLETRALWGTYASLLKNMILGVNKKFEKTLIIEGIGYKVENRGKKLVFNLGFSHPIEIEIPEGLEVSVEKDKISISGLDKAKVGQFSANLRKLKKPEPYKGKGIRYSDEVIRRKQGKKAA